jgi:hypothetical protein
MTTPQQQVFFLAAFDSTGELVGQSVFDPTRLSARWLLFCERLLAGHGEQVAVTLAGPLAHIALRFTSASGAAIGTFSAGGHLVNSILFLSGREPDADTEVSEMFHRSVSGNVFKLQSTSNPSPFCDLFKIEDRPLACIVAWGNPEVTEEEDELITELSWHLAGAFFSSQAG